jgi:hypothetical protein
MESANDGLPEDRRIVLRIGINLGDVMVERSDLYGDGDRHLATGGVSVTMMPAESTVGWPARGQEFLGLVV